MTTEKTKSERTPAEVWDALAIKTTRSLLAPNGFKRIHNGKREVSAISFLGKQTVNQVSAVGANLVRLYRENVKERIKEIDEDVRVLRNTIEENIQDCRFWQFKRKARLRRERSFYNGQSRLLASILEELDSIKPAAPKTKKEEVKK